MITSTQRQCRVFTTLKSIKNATLAIEGVLWQPTSKSEPAIGFLVEPCTAVQAIISSQHTPLGVQKIKIDHTPRTRCQSFDTPTHVSMLKCSCGTDDEFALPLALCLSLVCSDRLRAWSLIGTAVSMSQTGEAAREE